MEKEREIQKDYPNFLVKCLERIKKTASQKKFKSFREEINSAIGIKAIINSFSKWKYIEILNKSGKTESGNNYFWLLKVGIELKNNKLTDSILTTLKVQYIYEIYSPWSVRVIWTVIVRMIVDTQGKRTLPHYQTHQGS